MNVYGWVHAYGRVRVGACIWKGGRKPMDGCVWVHAYGPMGACIRTGGCMHTDRWVHAHGWAGAHMGGREQVLDGRWAGYAQVLAWQLGVFEGSVTEQKSPSPQSRGLTHSCPTTQPHLHPAEAESCTRHRIQARGLLPRTGPGRCRKSLGTGSIYSSSGSCPSAHCGEGEHRTCKNKQVEV